MMRSCANLLMIIRNFDFMCAVGLPHETKAVLIVNTNAVLALAGPLKRRESVPWKNAQIPESPRGVQHQ